MNWKDYEDAPISVELLACTDRADDLLCYTKLTRTDCYAATWCSMEMPDAEKSDLLKYISKTIPSSWEFVDYIFHIRHVTRNFTHQFVRHRHASFAQQSFRTVDASGFKVRYHDHATDEQKQIIAASVDMAVKAYDAVLNSGGAPEVARQVLPSCCTTSIIAKFNLRSLAEMAASRKSYRAESEMRHVTDMMLDAAVKATPWAEQFIYPDGYSVAHELCVQGDAIKNLATDVMKMSDKIKGMLLPTDKEED